MTLDPILKHQKRALLSVFGLCWVRLFVRASIIVKYALHIASIVHD
jgi:hypothetical protein